MHWGKKFLSSQHYFKKGIKWQDFLLIDVEGMIELAECHFASTSARSVPAIVISGQKSYWMTSIWARYLYSLQISSHRFPFNSKEKIHLPLKKIAGLNSSTCQCQERPRKVGRLGRRIGYSTLNESKSHEWSSRHGSGANESNQEP